MKGERRRKKPTGADEVEEKRQKVGALAQRGLAGREGDLRGASGQGQHVGGVGQRGLEHQRQKVDARVLQLLHLERAWAATRNHHKRIDVRCVCVRVVCVCGGACACACAW